MVTYTCNDSTWELKAGGSEVRGHPQLYSKVSQEAVKVKVGGAKQEAGIEAGEGGE